MSRPFGSRNSKPRSDLKMIPRSLADYPSPTPQPTPCRLWQWRTNNQCYGEKWDAERQKMVLVHRWVWEQIHGPTELKILHKCDNPLCYRYEHLFAGTQADNARDMMAKGRGRGQFGKGEETPTAKLTRPDVDSIRARLARGGVTMSALAREYNVHPTTILAIRERRNWA